MGKTFGMLEEKFKILQKRVDIPLHHMSNLVIAYTCIVNSNGFYMDEAFKTQKEAQAKTNSTFDNIKGVDMFKVIREKNK